MAEYIMSFVGGFLVASLIGIMLAAPLWRRAVLITTKRLNASSPVSVDDFNAARDRMRAEFAMSSRKLEMSVENLRKKAESQLAEIDQREREVSALRDEMKEQVDVVTRQQAEIEELKQRLFTAETALSRRERDLLETQEKLAEARTVLARQSNAIREANSLVEGQKEEIATIASRLEATEDEVAEKSAMVAERDEQLSRCGRTVAEQKRRVAEERKRVIEQDRVIAELTSEIEALRGAPDVAGDEALARLAAAERRIGELEAEAGRLRARLADGAGAEREARETREREWSPAANLRLVPGTADARSETDAAAARTRAATLAERIRALQDHLRSH